MYETEVTMPRPSREHNNNYTEPSAPPIHLMPEESHGNQDHPVDWGPPPRYEEAIADDDTTITTSQIITTRLPAPTTHDQPNEQPSSARRSQDSHSVSSGRRSRQTGSLTNIENRSSHQQSDIRYRSASPGEMSDGAQNGSSQECGSVNDSGSRKKKRGSKSKIKKGLENIAFFIIQILD